MSTDMPGWAEPITIIKDRYSGVYSGGDWLAYWGTIRRIEDGGDLEDAHGSDPECRYFFAGGHPEVAVGATPFQALQNLLAKES